jgi:hypothetical protein
MLLRAEPSDDGVSWDHVDLAFQSGSVLDLESGHVFYSDGVGREMFVSTDLKTWDRVDTSPLAIRSSPTGAGSFAGFAQGTQFSLF